jgi:hypothetical protein
MKTYSFIDFGLQDFLRTSNGEVLRLKFPSYEAAETWLMIYGVDYGFTNEGVRYLCWEEE